MAKKSELVQARMTPAEVDLLRAVANERSCSIGAVMRWAVKTAMLGDPPGTRQRGKKEGRAAVSETTGAPLPETAQPIHP